MPLYPLTCTAEPCKHEFEAAALDPKHRDEIRCPKCAAATRLDWSRMSFKTDRIYGLRQRRTNALMFHPSEVAEARRMLPSHTITDEGDVLYEDAGHLRQCDRELERVRSTATAIRAEREAQESAQAEPEPGPDQSIEVLAGPPAD